MIKLRSGTVFVERSGARIALDLDELQRDVERACRAAGMREPDLARDVVEIARGLCRRRAANPPSLPALDQMVVQALVDSGLVEVARSFQQLRSVPPPTVEGDFRPVDELAVEDILSADPWFFSRTVDDIAARVRQALAQLGLVTATPAFVRQLARHLWSSRKSAPVVLPADGPGYWLIGREQLAAMVAELTARDWAADGISFRPVSALFPRLAVDWDLLRLSAAGAQPVLTELIFLPAFDAVCRDLAVAVRPLRQRIALAAGEPTVPVTVTLRQAAQLAGIRLGLGPRQQQNLVNDLAAQIDRHLGADPETTIEAG